MNCLDRVVAHRFDPRQGGRDVRQADRSRTSRRGRTSWSAGSARRGSACDSRGRRPCRPPRSARTPRRGCRVSGARASPRAGCCRTWMWWSRNDSGLPGLQGLHPEADLAQLDGHRVDVDAVDATADHVAHGLADRSPATARRRRCARPARCLAIRSAAAIRKWPLPQAGSQIFSSSMAASGSGLLRRLSEHRVEGRVEQAG